MRNRAESECSRVRKTLQDLHDAGGKPRGQTAEHLLHCKSCAAFEAFLEGLAWDLRKALDQSTARLPEPDYPGLFAHPRGKRVRGIARRFAIPGIAAVFVALAIPSVIVTLSSIRERAAMQKTMTTFVDDLFTFSSAEKLRAPTKGTDTSSQALDSLLEDLAAD